MNFDQAWEKLLAEGVRFWLDDAGQLRVEKDAPEDLKNLIREHKSRIIALFNAHDLMNRSSIRLIRLPLGGMAVAKPPGLLSDEVAGALKVLELDHLPVVLNDEGLRWIPYDQWVREQVLDFSKPMWTEEEKQDWIRKKQQEQDQRAMLRNRRRRA
jgi:hypothetical protein